MVMDAAEAAALIATRDRTGRQLVVALPGQSLPAGPDRGAADRKRRGRRAPQRQRRRLAGLARQHERDVAAGSRLVGRRISVRYGAHMLNTVIDIAGEDVVEVAAWMDDDGSPVDIRGVVIARLASGALVTMNGAGARPSLRVGHPPLL